MMPNKFRLTIFLLLCLVYMGTSTIKAASDRYAMQQYFEILSAENPDANVEATTKSHLDKIARTVDSTYSFNRRVFDSLAYRIVFIRYTGLAMWLYLCACFIDYFIASRRRRTGNAE